MPRGYCTVQGCGKHAKLAGGLCKAHGPRTLCSVQSCSSIARTRGRCQRHLKACTPTTTPPLDLLPHGVFLAMASGGAAMEQCKPHAPFLLLPSLVLPVGLTAIAGGVYAESAWLTELVVPEGFRWAGDRAFSDCVNLETVRLPSSFQGGGAGLFAGCGGLRSVEFHPDSQLKTIAPSMFAKCTRLAQLTVPRSVVTVGSRAFAESGLQSLHLPGTVVMCFATAFAGCDQLRALTLSDGCTAWADNGTEVANLATAEAVTVTRTPALPHTQSQIEVYCHDTSLVIAVPTRGPAAYSFPDPVREIGRGVFAGMRWLHTIDLGEASVLNEGVFLNCVHLVELDLGKVVDIPAALCQGCAQLTRVTFARGLHRIGDRAFAQCPAGLDAALPTPANDLGNCYWVAKSAFSSWTPTPPPTVTCYDMELITGGHGEPPRVSWGFYAEKY